MAETCNSRHLSRLMKSCFPNPDTDVLPVTPVTVSAAAAATAISSLPDDLLLEILSRVPTASLPPLPSVCRRWSVLLLSASFHHLHRLHHPLRPSLLLLSPSTSLSYVIPLLAHGSHHVIATRSLSPPLLTGLPHARLLSVGPHAFLISPSGSFLFNSLTLTLASCARMLTPRKNFASASLSGKIYVAGGKTSSTSASPSTVEEYDPESDSWRVVANSSRRRYGCVGAAADGVFYVIGGLRFGNSAGQEAHVYASSMDLFDVEARVWLRSRSVPGGGCVVGACSTADGFVYVLASHALESSFWRFDGRRKRRGGDGGGGGFGEWRRMRSPPLPAQVRLDTTVKFSCVAVGEAVAVVQVAGCIDDLLRRSGRSERGRRGGLVLVYDTNCGEWSRGPDLPEVMSRALCTCVEC